VLFRSLRRQPGFTATAVLTLALGIGATTAVFTVVDGVLLRPLPYRDPERLLILLNGRNGRLSASFSPPNYRDITASSGVFADAAAMNPSSVNLTGAGDPQQLDGADVTWNFFSVLGVAPQSGRLFVEADAQGDALAVVISDALWRRLGSRRDIVGDTLRLDGRAYAVIGVAGPETTFPGRADYWRPLVFTPHQLSDSQRGAQWVNVVARLKPRVSLSEANAALATVGSRLAVAYPGVNRGRQFAAARLHDRLVTGIRPALLVLLGAVALVLLIACVNVANLLLARGYSRLREVAVRAAVGARRTRLVQQFLAESLVLGGTGAAAGLIVAIWSLRALAAVGPANVPQLADIGIDWRVLGFTAATAIGTSVLFGLVPALAATSVASPRSANSGGRGAIGHAGTRLRKSLVVAEMALAVVLLAGAGLLMRSYREIVGVNPGFSPDHVLTFRIALPLTKYDSTTAISRFVEDYVQRLAHAGAQSASAVFGLPLDTDFNAFSTFTRPGVQPPGEEPMVGMRIITPDYLQTLKIPLKRGRLFNEHDTETSPEVVLINEEAARRYWADVDPIGQQLHLGARIASVPGVRSGQKTIVGVVGNVKKGGLDAAVPPEVYLPYTQHPIETMTIVVRTAGEPLAFVPTARAELAAVDRELPLSAIRPMADVVGRSIAERKFTMILLASFAVVAVALATIGVYGVLAYVVSQRTQEIGVRLAIGAAPDDVMRLFVREGARLAVAGLALGLVAALAAARLLTALLFGVTAADPETFALVLVALGSAALAASYLPARRAARIDPMEALRVE